MAQSENGLVGLFRNTLENPLFLAGAGMFSAGSQGKDIGAGLLGASSIMKDAYQQQIEREKQQAVQDMLSKPMAGVDPNVMRIAQATRDPSLLAQGIFRQPQADLARQQLDHNRQMLPLDLLSKRAQIAASGQSLAHAQALHPHQLTQARIAAATAQRDFDAPKPNTFDLGEGHVRYEQRRMPDGTVQAVPIAQGGVKQDAASKKAIWESQDELPALQGTIEALARAKELNKQAYAGYTAGARGAVMTGMPFGIGQTGPANATTEYQNIVNQQAIEAMSRTLKGATTDKEMGQFLKIIGDLSQPPELRARVLDRLMSLANRQMQIKAARIKELGGRMPDFAAPAQDQPQPQESKTINGRTYVRIGDQWFEQ